MNERDSLTRRPRYGKQECDTSTCLKIGVSFLNSALLKYKYPGTTPVKWEDFYEDLYRKENLTPEVLFARRERDLLGAIESAKALGARWIRGFTYWRIGDPASLLSKLTESYRQMTAVGKKHGIGLCVENEHSTNTGTTLETLALLKKVPGLYLNSQNSFDLGEKDVFPKGFETIPKNRIANVQIKAAGLLGPGEPINWPGIFQSLEQSGYGGCFGLETHTLKGPEINVPASHRCMQRLLELVNERA